MFYVEWIDSEELVKAEWMPDDDRVDAAADAWGFDESRGHYLIVTYYPLEDQGVAREETE